MNNNLQARHAILWSLAENIGQQLLLFLIFSLLARLIPPETFGVISTALFVIFLIQTFINGYALDLVARTTVDSSDLDAAFIVALILTLISFFCLLAVSAPLSAYFELPELRLALMWLSPLVLVTGTSCVPIAWARRKFLFKPLAIRSIFSVITGGILSLALASLGYPIGALVTNQLLAATLSGILLWWWIEWRPHWSANRFDILRTFRSGGIIGLSQCLQFSSQNADTAIVTYILGAHEGGLYAAAKRIVGACQMAIWQSVAAATLPEFSRNVNSGAQFDSVLLRTTSTVLAVASPIYLIIALNAATILKIVFGNNWTDASPALYALCAGGVLLPANGVISQVLLVRDMSHVTLVLASVQLLTYVCVALFSPPSGIFEVSVLMVIPYVFTYVFSVFVLWYRHAFPIKRYIKALFRLIVASAVSATAIVLARYSLDGEVISTLLSSLVGLILYVLCLAVIDPSAFNLIASLIRLRLRRGPGSPPAD